MQLNSPLFNMTEVHLKRIDVHSPLIPKELPVALIIVEPVTMCDYE